MKKNDTVTVNGQSYDKRTGLPISAAPVDRPVPTPAPRHQARTLHSATQKSKTLRRTAAQKPSTTPATPAPLVAKRPQRRSLDIARHPHVRKVAPAPEKAPEAPDIAPRTHPHAEKANQHVAAKKTSAHVNTSAARNTMSTKEVKDAEISRALAASPDKKAAKPKKQRSHRRKKITKLSTIGISIAIILGVILWINLPSLSVRFASSQTGVNATIPHYTPEGFRLQWPVGSDNNQVSMKFASNEGDTSFTLHQSSSSWNSDAVRTMVEDRSEGRFLTARDRGITVYTYDGNAAWVNRGILYTIDGNAQLSSDVVMRIANSL